MKKIKLTSAIIQDIKFSKTKKQGLHLFILTLLMIISRLPFVNKFLYEWDSVQYALSFNKFNVLQHQPHPPGYILFVALGKITGLVIKDPNSNLIFLVFLFGLGTLYLSYFLAKEAFGVKVGFLAALLLLFNPIFWFYTEISTIYIAEAFFCILIAFLCYCLIHKKHDVFLYLSTLVLGLAGGVRQNIVLFMFPLWIWSVLKYTKSVKKLFITTIVLALTISCWFFPLIYLSGGYKKYKAVSQSLYLYLLKGQSIFLGASLLGFIKGLKNLVIWTFLDFFPLFFIFFIFFSLKKKKEIWSSPFNKSEIIFWALWILPSFFFYMWIFIAKAGYTMTYLPAIHILCAYFLLRISKSLHQKYTLFSSSLWLKILIVIILGLNITYFLAGSLLEEVISSKVKISADYSQKSLKENFYYQTSLFFQFTNGAIRKVDQISDDFIRTIRALPYSPDEMVIIFFSPPNPWDWRKAMFYLPEYTIYLACCEIWNGKEVVNAFMGKNKTLSCSLGNDSFFDLNQFGNQLNIFLNKKIKYALWIVHSRTDYFDALSGQVVIEKIEKGMCYFYITRIEDDKPFSINIKNINFINNNIPGNCF